MNKKIVFSAGGTGGHIFPTINLMKFFHNNNYEVLLITDIRGKSLINKYLKFNSYTINSGTFSNKNIFLKFLSFFLILFSIIKSIFILVKEKPNLVFGLGGYVSFPISFASKFLNIPLVIYENNLILGRANKYLLPLSKKILLGTAKPINFPKKYENKISLVGNILKEEIMNYKLLKKKQEKENFTILVLGGSQGAKIFGDIIPLVIKKLKDKAHKIEILQQSIEFQKNSIIEFYNKNNIKNNVFSFTNNILDLISLSDLAISRSGASTIAELTQTCTPFIAVPYPFSVDNHQYFNAKHYESKGCCWLINQNNFDAINLFNLIIKIIENRNILENARENMKKNGSKDVYNKIKKEIEEII